MGGEIVGSKVNGGNQPPVTDYDPFQIPPQNDGQMPF